MYTIQYATNNGEHRTEAFESKSRQKLVTHLARYQYPIVAVYEQASPITKTVRKLLADCPYKSSAARDFINSPA